MAAFEIRQFGDPVLRTPASPVREFDDALGRLIEGMLQTLRAGEGRMALAANQVGVLKRVFVAQTGGERFVVVNPIIEERTEETVTDLEGCLSILGIGVQVERHEGVVVSVQDERGHRVRFEVGGGISRMMQHEIDHLDGVLMLGRADPDSCGRATREWHERMLARRAGADTQERPFSTTATSKLEER